MSKHFLRGVNMVKAQHVLVIAVALAMFSCSSSSKSTNPATSSSSAGASSGVVSSSSIAAAPTGTRAATLADLPRIAQFPSQAGYSVKYIFGASGIYSKLFLDSLGNVALQAVGSFALDSAGVMTLKNQDCLATQTRRDSLCTNAFLDASMIFYVKKDTVAADTLLETKDNLTLTAIHAGTLTENPVRVSSFADVEGVWTIGNTTNGYTFEFYPDYRYVRSTYAAGVQTIETGKYDVQKDQLLTLENKCTGSYFAVGFFAAVKNADQLRLTSATATTTDTLAFVSAVDTSFKASSLMGTWTGNLKDANNTVTHTFTLGFQSAGVVNINAYDATSGSTAYTDDGVYSSIGPWLILDFNLGSMTCSGNGTLGAVVNGKTRCYGLIINKAVVTGGDSLVFVNSYIPTQWVKK